MPEPLSLKYCRADCLDGNLKLYVVILGCYMMNIALWTYSIFEQTLLYLSIEHCEEHELYITNHLDSFAAIKHNMARGY